MSTVPQRLTAALADRYRLERELGAGGMATVYLAEDVRHDRKVAVKVLRPELAAVLGAERFVQEIKTTAALQHPHILPLFDSGEADGFLYYVMPYVEGETLRDKLDRETQLGIDEALRVTTEVADALHYAHGQGVIHRDIKPENILLHDGRPMVADFGIALAVSAAAGGRMTETGMSLGTPHYMSPEQATAEKDLTNRSDIYSLGAVLYEMLTGDPPHTGSSAQQIIMKIVTEDAAPVTTLRKSVPVHVADAVAIALEKLPADRFESADAFARALADSRIARARGGGAAAAAGAPRRVPGIGSARMAWLTAAGLVAAGAGAGWFLRPDPELQPAPVTRFTIAVPDGHDLRAFEPNVTVSRDGRMIAYFSGGVLYRRDLDTDQPLRLAEEPDGCCPVFLPDGEWILFKRGFDANRLLGVAVDGGAAVEIEERPLASDLMLGAFASGIRLRRAGETDWVTLTSTDSLGRENGHRWPQVLADGRRLLFTVLGQDMMWTGASIGMLDLETDRRATLVTGATQGVYVPTGHLVYVRAEGTLEAIAVDVERMETVGNAVIMEEGIRTAYWGGAGSFAVSETGTLAFVRGSQWVNHRLTWLNRRGEVVGHVGNPVTVEGIRLSPDERFAVTYVASANADIARFDLATGDQRRLTFDAATEDNPIWSPDGRRVAYRKVVSGGDHRVLVMSLDGQTEGEELYRSPAYAGPVSWAPDGSAVVIEADAVAASMSGHLLVLHLGRDRVDTLPGRDGSLAQFSPDGRWIAYESMQTGVKEVYVIAYPNLANQQQVSTNGGRAPEWAADTGELFFITRDTLKVTRATTRSGFDWTTPEPLFAFADRVPRTFAVTRDGQRILYPAANPDALAREIHVVVNWFEELNRRLGN